MVAADLQLIQGVAKRLKQGRDDPWNYEVQTTITHTRYWNTHASIRIPDWVRVDRPTVCAFCASTMGKSMISN